MAAGAVTLDRNNTILYCNTVFSGMIGIPMEHLIGSSFLDLVPVEGRNTFMSFIERSRTGNSLQELPLKTASGKELYVHLAGGCERHDVHTSCIVVTDISARKRAEEALQLHSEILLHMAEGVHVTRLEDRTTVYTNPRFDLMFGYEPGELIGKPVSVVNAPGEKDPEGVAQEIVTSLEQTGVWTGEVHNIRKDGTLFWCRAHVSVLDHPGYGRVGITVNADITERKQIEDPGVINGVSGMAWRKNWTSGGGGDCIAWLPPPQDASVSARKQIRDASALPAIGPAEIVSRSRCIPIPPQFQLVVSKELRPHSQCNG